MEGRAIDATAREQAGSGITAHSAEGDRSLDAILRPRSVAVIGASRDPDSVGYHILANLVKGGFTGPVFPVNPRADSVHSIRAFPTIGAVAQPVDLAVVVVPKEAVPPVTEECGRAGVRALVVISAGFKETGPQGAEAEQRLLATARTYRMRLVGPNCLGVLNRDPAVSLNATFAPILPPFGHAAFVSQSGALGVSVLDYANELGIGISQFVSLGNKADVSGNDVLLHWEHDPAVGVILMYVESFGNPRRFLEIASRLSRTKPIIVVKAGRSKVGARAAASHTGALAASDAAVDALLAQAGVLRAASIEELFDMAMAFTGRTLPRSRRTAVVTNSGGPGILAADALEAGGFDLVELQRETVARLASLFPAEASIRNPLDMIATVSAAGYRQGLETVLGDTGVDSVIAVFVPPLGVRQAEVAEAIGRAAAAQPLKPVLAVLMGREGLPQGRAELGHAGIPAFVFPESAARALAALRRHSEWRARPAPAPARIDADARVAERLIAQARLAGRRKLDETEALALLEAYGIRTAAARVAPTIEDAVRAAEDIGYPVVLKVTSPDIVHKTEVGGVRVDIEAATELRQAAAEMLDAVGRAARAARIAGFVVQRMARGGRETIAGFSRDSSFGALLMFGLGGIYVEALRDVMFRIAPIHALDAHDMIHGLRSIRILEGVRGAPPVAFTALTDTLLRLSHLAIGHPEIQELDINPLLAFPDGVMAVDARVLLSPAQS
jgi:acetyl coenzyme A synthetase (ADP forming)-like protein